MISSHSIASYLYKHQNNTPDKTAIIDHNKKITYRQLFSRMEDYVRTFENSSVKKGDIIGVKISDSIEFVAIMFASAACGLSIAPVDKTLPEIASKQRFQSLGISFVLTDETVISSKGTENIFYPELDGNETYILSLTSGSTSEPKSIELSQNIKIKRAKAHIDLYHLNQNDIILASTPLYHSLAERLVIMSAILGATIVIMDEFRPHEWFNLVHGEKVTFTISESSQLSQISQMLLSPFVPEITSLKTVVSSSSLLENHIKKELIDKLHCDLYEIYGTSETSTLTNLDLRSGSNIRSVGTPLNGVELKILEADENGIGEIACKSPLMFKGYFNEPDLTQRSYQDGYFKTGDLGKIDEKGFLYYNGRKHELIKSNGINIYPIDIEDTVCEMEKVKECAVFSYPDDLKGDVIALALTVKDNQKLETAEIKAYCEDKLPELARPQYVFILPELPKNEMGKIRKNKIYEYIIRQQMSGEY